jgi:TIR domain-containing protein
MPFVDSHNYRHDRKDVFISGSHSDTSKLELIGQRLMESGLSVFHSGYSLPAGVDYHTYIRHYLQNSSTVLVCWSVKSVESDWVNAEAEYARENNLLVACKVGPCALLPPFNTFQTVELSDWQGEADDVRWQQLLSLLKHRKSRRIEDFVQLGGGPGRPRTVVNRVKNLNVSAVAALAALILAAGLIGWLLRGSG